MSHFECRNKSTFFGVHKSGTSCPNLGRGWGGNLDKIQKNSNFFLNAKNVNLSVSQNDSLSKNFLK